MKPKVSIIVPVYNAENHLSQCIDSLLNQTLKSIEIILINDGSKDNSKLICEKFKEKDNRVKVVHIDNQGVSNARNIGIKMALGDYITFVDADDWIKKETYFDMINIIESCDADIGIFAHYLFDGKVSKYIGLPYETGKILNYGDIIKNLIPLYISPVDQNGKKHMMIFGSVWKCIFKKQLIFNNDILFENKLKYTEDLVFILKTLIKSNRVVFNNKAYYYYRRDRKEMTATTQRYIEGIHENLKLSQNIICELLNESGQIYSLNKSLEVRNCFNLLQIIYNICAKDSPYTFLEKIKVATKMKKELNFNHSIDLVKYSSFELKQRILFVLLRHDLIFLVIILYKIKNILKKGW